MARRKQQEQPIVHATEQVEVPRLTPHPRNYREHPEDQLAHLMQSLREHGFYRNVVIAEDDVILAGHGVVEAARRIGLETIPVVRLPIASDSPKALKLVAADNEIGRFAVVDDRALSELLAIVRENDLDGLLGTGYDEAMLANLVYVTRPASEIQDRNIAEHWAGLPDFGGNEFSLKVVVQFETEDDRLAFMERIGASVVQYKNRGTWALWYPERPINDAKSIRFEAEP
jgi:hypothetical protein